MRKLDSYPHLVGFEYSGCTWNIRYQGYEPGVEILTFSFLLEPDATNAFLTTDIHRYIDDGVLPAAPNASSEAGSPVMDAMQRCRAIV